VSKTPARPESIRRKEVLVIQNDPERYPEDKLRDIRELLRETTVTNNVFSDPDGSFVACGHTLDLLGGALAADRRTFYDKWTARIDGFRVCRFCSEQINNDVYVDTEEYDEEGFLIRSSDALEGQSHSSSGIADFVTGLRRLQPLFIMDQPHDDTVFLTLSVLQVLPTAEMLEPLLKLGRQITNKGSADQIARFKGMVGLATAALVIQCHIPSLVPRRSFGPRPLVLSGYPRDTDKPAEYTIVDTLMGVLRKTFEAFPISFTGSSKSVIRAILNKPSEVKNTVIKLLSDTSPLMKSTSPVTELLARAKAYVAASPPVEQPKTLIPVVTPPKEFGTITSYEACPSVRPIWTSGRDPRVVQDQVPLRPGIQAARNAIPVPPTPSERVIPAPIPKAEIRTRLSTGTKLASKIKVGNGARTNLLLASRLADMFRQPAPVRAVDPAQSADEQRDIAKGFVFEQLADIRATPAKQAKLDELAGKDVALYMLQADYREEKSLANKLRATERLKIVEDLKKKSDTERELIQQLLSIGAAPYLLTQSDRSIFAQEAERQQDQARIEEEDLAQVDAEIGVGLVRDNFDDGDEDERGVDHGEYGDRAALPEGRDTRDASLLDDPARSI
jgi:hypothetical protein